MNAIKLALCKILTPKKTNQNYITIFSKIIVKSHDIVYPLLLDCYYTISQV